MRPTCDSSCAGLIWRRWFSGSAARRAEKQPTRRQASAWIGRRYPNSWVIQAGAQRCSTTPQLAGREFGAFGESHELRPCDQRMDSSTEAAVGAGNQVFAADDLRKPDDPIRNKTRMLDHIGRMAHDAG